jgi:hypothetical protein
MVTALSSTPNNLYYLVTKTVCFPAGRFFYMNCSVGFEIIISKKIRRSDMTKKIIFLLSFVFISAFSGELTKKKLNLSYVEWDAYMLGIDTPGKVEALRKNVKRVPVIALVSFSGVDEKSIRSGVEYVSGPFKCRGTHDTYQIYELIAIAGRVGVPVKIRVYTAENAEQIADGFRQAGKNADIVIIYSSIWQNPELFQKAIAENPDTLYISPYVEVGDHRTKNAFQGGARHPDGTGLRNFITTLPLSRQKPAGKLLIPSCRDSNDTETVNFIAPSSYASSYGETCPSAGVAAAVAAYIASVSETRVPAEKIIQIMLKNTGIPVEQMLQLKDFDSGSVQVLRDHLKALTSPDTLGIRRLESDGILNLWKIHQSLAGNSN